jgi:hypothetical protein
MSIEYDSIMVCEVENLPSSFDGDVIFVLPPLADRVPISYGQGMDKGWTIWL